ncbi:hypothetical protein [Actinacidiphila glaucinigra]|uniref:hypothetical protein n=1 Tax=Actinacidiphila glaucinigra TaxID=235986 RepID=UPI0035E34FB5
MIDRTAYLDRIRQAWVNTDDADQRLADLEVDPARFRAIIDGTQKATSLDLALIATAFRVTVMWILTAEQPRAGFPAAITCAVPNGDDFPAACSEPAGHDGAHGGPIIVDGVHVGGAGWDEAQPGTRVQPAPTPEELRERFDTIRAQMAAPLPTTQEITAGSVEDRAMAVRVREVRPGVPLHYAYATLQALREIQRHDGGGA